MWVETISAAPDSDQAPVATRSRTTSPDSIPESRRCWAWLGVICGFIRLALTDEILERLGLALNRENSLRLLAGGEKS